jgi:hypothetical protein
MHLRRLIEDYRDAEVTKAESQFAYNDLVQRIEIENDAQAARHRLNHYLASLETP